MIPGAKINAAIEILDDIFARKRPASEALRDWGLEHRFAGSKDRAGIGTLVYDALRHKASAAYIMGADSSRAMVLGALKLAHGLEIQALTEICTGEGHAAAPLDEAEARRFTSADLSGAPAHVAGDFPDWLEPHFTRLFGDEAIAQTQALAARAPVDLRVNTLNGKREKALKALAHLHPERTPFSELGLRLPLLADGRGPPVVEEKAYIKGLVEIQDEGSQIAVLLACAKPGEQVMDLCAGAGGKSLGLAAQMENTGQIYATDSDIRRLAPIYDRIIRAGARNIQVRPQRGKRIAMGELKGKCDLIFVDAPCTGTGTWRRNPDAKWRIRPSALEERIKLQDQTLDDAVRFVKPQGRILYVTCSLLIEENEDRVTAFLARHSGFKSIPGTEMAAKAGLPHLASCASKFGDGLRLTPYTNQTDGFFIAELVNGSTPA